MEAIDLRLRSKNRFEVFYLIGALLFCLASLFVIYRAPYCGDDVINSYTKGALTYYHRSIWEHTSILFQNWIHVGRFYPLAFYSYALFTWLPTLFAYRTFQIILNMAVIVSFAVLILQITKSKLLSAYAVILLPVIFQFRYYFDPILAFHGLLQFVALYVIWASVFLLLGIEKKKIRFAVIGALFFAAAIMTYEISFAFILLFTLMPLTFGKCKGKWFYVLPYWVACALLLIITIILRVTCSSAYGGTSFGLSIPDYLRTFLYQAVAALPFSYLIFVRHPFLPLTPESFLKYVNILDVGTTCLLLAFLVYGVFRANVETNRSKLWFYGLAFWLLPVSIFSLSERYQKELTLGMGYLPVYVEYFGVAMLILWIFVFVLQRIRKRTIRRSVGIVVSLLLCCMYLLNATDNRRVTWQYMDNNTQVVSMEALQTGLLRDLDDGDQIINMEGGAGMNFEPTSFICLYSNSVQLQVRKVEELAKTSSKAEKKECVLHPTDTYVYCASGDPELGMAQVGKVLSMQYNPKDYSIVRITVSEAVVYLSGGQINSLTISIDDKTPITFCGGVIFDDPLSEDRTIPIPAENASSVTVERLTAVDHQTQWDRLTETAHSDSCLVRITPTNGSMNFPVTGIP